MADVSVICIGKAAQDIFLQGDVFKPKRENGVLYEHLTLGEKFYVEGATFSTGGNAPNAAVTFARQGLDVTFFGTVGSDPAGQAILSTLDDEHINTSNVVVEEDSQSSFSTILLAPTGERTILGFPGTVELHEDHIPLTKLQADWLYLSSLGSMKLLEKVMKTAFANGIKIAFNPASFELKYVRECKELLQYVTLFAVNKEEAVKFASGENIAELATNLSKKVSYVLVSDGPKGAVATDGKQLISAGIYEDVPVIDRTGAGDAFTSGFVSQIAQGREISRAIVFASANSTSVVGKIGAKAGILRRSARLHEMPLRVTPLI